MRTMCPRVRKAEMALITALKESNNNIIIIRVIR